MSYSSWIIITEHITAGSQCVDSCRAPFGYIQVTPHGRIAACHPTWPPYYIRLEQLHRTTSPSRDLCSLLYTTVGCRWRDGARRISSGLTPPSYHRNKLCPWTVDGGGAYYVYTTGLYQRLDRACCSYRRPQTNVKTRDQAANGAVQYHMFYAARNPSALPTVRQAAPS